MRHIPITNSQHVQVEASAKARNFRNCNSGYPGCEAGMLTEEQRVASVESAARRNRYSCQHGYSTCVTDAQVPGPSATFKRPVGIERASLTAMSSSIVVIGPRDAYGGLSPTRVKQASEPAAVEPAIREAHAAASGPSCAENGSCYGDISSSTFRSKTTHVGGYTRSNGTYVRGYYRSK